MCQELQIFAVVYMYSGAGCLVRLCDSDFGITPVDDITIGITCASLLLPHSIYFIRQFLVLVLFVGYCSIIIIIIIIILHIF